MSFKIITVTTHQFKLWDIISEFKLWFTFHQIKLIAALGPISQTIFPSQFKFDGKLFSVWLHCKVPFRYEILHLSRQHICHVMCKVHTNLFNITWIFQNLLNSLSLWRGGCDFKCVNFNHNLEIDILQIQVNVTLEWMTGELGVDCKSTLGQIMAWCCQATISRLSECWPKYMLLDGVTRPQWVKIVVRLINP